MKPTRMKGGSLHITNKRVPGVSMKAMCGRKKIRGFIEVERYLKAVEAKKTAVIESVCGSCRNVADEIYGLKPQPESDKDEMSNDCDGMPQRSLMLFDN